jgi:hypothetical protein
MMTCATYHCAGTYPLSKTVLNNWVRYFTPIIGNSLWILPVMSNLMISKDFQAGALHQNGNNLSLSYGRIVRLGIGLPLGPMTRFYPYSFFSGNCFVVLPVGRPLWREDGSVTYSAIADWSGHWGPITIHYRLIWDCVSSSSPLTTRRDYGGCILTCVHMRWKQRGITLTKMYWLLGRKSKLSTSNKFLIYKTILKPMWTSNWTPCTWYLGMCQIWLPEGISKHQQLTT